MFKQNENWYLPNQIHVQCFIHVQWLKNAHFFFYKRHTHQNFLFWMYITVRNIFMQYISLILYRYSLIEVELIKIMIYLFYANCDLFVFSFCPLTWLIRRKKAIKSRIPKIVFLNRTLARRRRIHNFAKHITKWTLLRI